MSLTPILDDFIEFLDFTKLGTVLSDNCENVDQLVQNLPPLVGETDMMALNSFSLSDQTFSSLPWGQAQATQSAASQVFPFESGEPASSRVVPPTLPSQSIQTISIQKLYEGSTVCVWSNPMTVADIIQRNYPQSHSPNCEVLNSDDLLGTGKVRVRRTDGLVQEIFISCIGPEEEAPKRQDHVFLIQNPRNFNRYDLSSLQILNQKNNIRFMVTSVGSFDTTNKEKSYTINSGYELHVEKRKDVPFSLRCIRLGVEYKKLVECNFCRRDYPEVVDEQIQSIMFEKYPHLTFYSEKNDEEPFLTYYCLLDII